MITKPATSVRNNVLRKLALYGGIALFALYVGLVAAGYSWLHFVRKNDQVRLADVAFARLSAIRSSIATQHFAQAQKEWDANRIPAAYLLFATAVRQDPSNVTGRLKAAQFLRSLGAGKLCLVMLEDGLAYTPDDRRLIETTFSFLLSTGREHHALDLLKQRYGAEPAGQNATLLQRYEIQATLVTDGATAAKKLLDQHAGLLQDTASTPVVARILWASQERFRAISLLQGYVQTQTAVYADFAQLAGWQAAGGKPADAVQTARRAVEKFPRELAPRILLIDTLVTGAVNAAAGQEAVTAYLRDFSGRSESLTELAAFAGRKGWVDLTRTLYQIGANRHLDLNGLALSYTDALKHEAGFKEIQEVLSEIERQAPENNPVFMVQLRQRQVINAAALGDSDNVREYSRRLAATVHGDPDALEGCRAVFQRLGITEAVSELTGRISVAKASPKK